MFCYSNNGYSMRAVDNDYIAQPGEILFADYATDEQLQAEFTNFLTIKQAAINDQQNNIIIQQIATLEEKQHRAVREIIRANPDVLSTGPTESVQRLQDLDNQIAELRIQLK